jgi:hypothetical protein
MKSLKFGLLSLVPTALVLILGLTPDPASSSRVIAAPIVGQITASPSSTEIEVDHHPYHIKAHSPAEKTSPTLNVGQRVSLILDGASGDPKSSVIGISTQPAT